MENSINLEDTLLQVIIEATEQLQEETVDKNKIALIRQKIKAAELLIQHQKQYDLEGRIMALENLVRQLDYEYANSVVLTPSQSDEVEVR
jgi:hypothetical protein